MNNILNFFEESGFVYDVKSFLIKTNIKYYILKENFLIKFLQFLKGISRRLITLFEVKNYDLIYIFLNVTPLGGSLIERLYRFNSKRIIYDIDDLVYLNKFYKENKIVKYFRSPNKYFYLMKSGDHVITCTKYLDNFVRKFNKKNN